MPVIQHRQGDRSWFRPDMPRPRSLKTGEFRTQGAGTFEFLIFPRTDCRLSAHIAIVLQAFDQEGTEVADAAPECFGR